jgi:hypothetical protein
MEELRIVGHAARKEARSEMSPGFENLIGKCV